MGLNQEYRAASRVKRLNQGLTNFGQTDFDQL